MSEGIAYARNALRYGPPGKCFFYKLLAAYCQGYELGERLDTVEKAGVMEVGGDVRETG